MDFVFRWSILDEAQYIFFPIRSLSELQDFIKVANEGLTKEVEEGDYNGLVDCMGHLMAVKDRQSSTDQMFEPLKQTIELLKTYDQEMSEEVHTQLQVRISFLFAYSAFVRNSNTCCTKWICQEK